ncbi:MAG: hypothetical protein M9894_08745 [Planctomycetes bacterium]|nr:hypothetical protein [Planctomycetota bacterium]
MTIKTRSTALVLSLSFVLSGCVDCSALRSWRGGERETPVNSVMALRYNLCQEDWAAAAQAIDLGSEFVQARGGDPTKEAFWRVPSPIMGEGALWFPLGPEDAVGEAQQAGTETLVELRHARRYEKDPRPRALLLEQRQGGEWLIVGYRNW